MSTEETLDRQPTKEELVAYLTESLEIAKLRAELQTFNTQIAVGRAEELKALVFIAQLTNPKEQPTEPDFEEDQEPAVGRKLKREKPTE
jgi:hypothetical protein